MRLLIFILSSLLYANALNRFCGRNPTKDKKCDWKPSNEVRSLAQDLAADIDSIGGKNRPGKGMCGGDYKKNTNCRSKTFKTSANHDDEFAVFKKRSTCYILARQTDGFEDWVSNLNCVGSAAKYKLANTKYSGCKGLINGYNNARKWIIEQLDDRSCNEYVFYGYSRGGAQVTAAAVGLVTEEKISINKVKLITFNAPRVFRRDDAGELHSRFKQRTWRFVWKKDPVSRVPARTGWLQFGARFEHFGWRVQNWGKGNGGNGRGPYDIVNLFQSADHTSWLDEKNYGFN